MKITYLCICRYEFETHRIKHFLDVIIRLSTYLHMELRSYPFRQGICISLSNFLPIYIIYFISNKRYYQLIRILLFTNLVKPFFSLLETVQICHIVY